MKATKCKASLDYRIDLILGRYIKYKEIITSKGSEISDPWEIQYEQKILKYDNNTQMFLFDKYCKKNSSMFSLIKDRVNINIFTINWAHF